MKRINHWSRGRIARWMERIVALLGLAGMALPLAAAPRFDFPSVVDLGEHVLEQRGTGHFTYWFFALYDGALYLSAEASPADVLEAVPKRLELAYHREIPAAKLVEAGEKILLRNATEAEVAAIAGGLRQINAAYRAVREGDRYALTYLPDIGTTLALNDEPLATIEDPAFARIYFRIWFGNDPVSADFRDDLMGE